MKNILLATVSIFLVTVTILFAGNAPMRPKREDGLEGKRAPNFLCMDLRGQRIGLPAGRPVLLVFFSPNDPAALTEAERMLREHPRSGAAALAIAEVPRDAGRGGDGGPATPPAQPPAKTGKNRGKGGGYGKAGGGQSQQLSPQIIQQLQGIQSQTALAVLVDLNGQAAGEYQARGGGMIAIDDQGVVRVHARGNAMDQTRVEETLAMFAGEAPDTFGWRNDLVFSMETALGKRDRQGRKIDPAKGKMGKGMVPPDQAARELKVLMPPTDLGLKVNYDQVPEQFLKPVKAAVEFAVKEWEKALPEVRFSFTDERDEADVVIGFMSEVLDPEDSNGIKTVCAHYRTLDEAGRVNAKSKGSGPNARSAPRIKTIAQIAFGHGQGSGQHNQQAIAHLASGAVGYALGLSDRKDPTSAMNPNADQGGAVRPSREDFVILRNLTAGLHFEIGKLQLDRGKTKEAQDEFDKIPKDSRYTRMAKELLATAGVSGKSDDASNTAGNKGKAKP